MNSGSAGNDAQHQHPIILHPSLSQKNNTTVSVPHNPGFMISNATVTSDSDQSLPKARKRSYKNAFSDSAPSTSKDCLQVPQQQTSPANGLTPLTSSYSLRSSPKTDSKVKLHSDIFQIKKMSVREGQRG